MQQSGRSEKPGPESYEDAASLLPMDRVDSEQSAVSISEDPDDLQVQRHDERAPRILSKSQVPRTSRRTQGRRYLPIPNADNDYELEDAAHGQMKSKPPNHRRRRACCAWGAVLCLIILALLFGFNAFFQVRRGVWTGNDNDPEDIFRNWGRPGSGTEELARYPTDFLRDVEPIGCHSHNDYWRKVPLLSALHAGCKGVEADVWLHNNELYVGHEPAALQVKRTFQSLYIKPLVKILQHQNPSTEFYNETYRGVFDTNPDQTLFLLVDVKTGGEETWPWVVKQIEPLRSRGWLTRYEDGKVIHGPVTVIGTGETPFQQVVENTTYRDAFFDAPLDKLENSAYDSTNSVYASVSFREVFGSYFAMPTAKQLDILRAQLKEAHNRKLLARYWELPAWPVHLRYQAWDLLTREGIDLLNVDDLEGAASQDWSKTGSA